MSQGETQLPTEAECKAGSRNWPHAPPHRLEHAGVYFLTARFKDQTHHLHSPQRRDWFQSTLHKLAADFGWRLEAWAVLSNHYHFVAHSPPGSAQSLAPFVKKLHSLTTQKLNMLDGTPGRSRLWHNYRETHLTLPNAYLARLNYVHQNAVHHGLVKRASQWAWCSALEFKEAVSPAWVRTVASFKFDQIAREDGE